MAGMRLLMSCHRSLELVVVASVILSTVAGLPQLENVFDTDVNELVPVDSGIPHHRQCSSTSECPETLTCISHKCKCKKIEYFEAGKCHPRVPYLGHCNRTLKCNLTLSCLHGKCQCVYPKYYVPPACVSPWSLNSQESPGQQRKPNYVQCTSTSECPETLTCIYGVCKCKSTQYFESGKCYTIIPYGGRCNDTFQCDYTISCINHTCQCHSYEYYYPPICRPKSLPDSQESLGLQKSSLDSQESLGQQRKPNYVPCTSTSECPETLTCIYGVCKCKSTQYFESGKCYTKKPHFGLCQRTSQCQETFTCIAMMCQCDYSQYFHAGKCYPRIPYNGHCNDTSQCYLTISCINYTCQCHSYEYYDPPICRPRW